MIVEGELTANRIEIFRPRRNRIAHRMVQSFPDKLICRAFALREGERRIFSGSDVTFGHAALPGTLLFVKNVCSPASML